MQGKLIIFDIDRTLFSTNGFRKVFKKRVEEELNLDPEKFQKAHDNHDAKLKSRSHFRPDKYLADLSKELGIGVKELSKIYYDHDNYMAALYPDAKDVLEELSGKHTLGIYSQGYKKFQQHKLTRTKIIQHFNPEHIYIFWKKLGKKSQNALPKESIVIDDSKEVVEKLSKNPNVKIIWLNRDNADKHPDVVTIHTLKDLQKVI